MAIEELTQDQKDSNLAFLKEQQQWQEIEKDKQRAHEAKIEQMRLDKEVELKRLEVRGIELRSKAEKRWEAVKAVLVGIVKLPALPFALLVLLTCVIKDQDPPEALDQFLYL